MIFGLLYATWFVAVGACIYLGASVFYAYNTQYTMSIIYLAYVFANVGLAMIGEGFK